MNVPRNDKDHFLYPHVIEITITGNNYEYLQHKDIGTLPSSQGKGKGSKY